MKENKKDVNDEKESSVKIRELSAPMAVSRIIIGFFGLLYGL